MKRIIELKHVVGPKRHVRALLEDLLDRLEGKLQHFQGDSVSVHALFEVNGAHKLYRAALTCHVPGRTAVAHEEAHDAGDVIRAVFAEVERQLEKHKAVLRREPLRKRAQRNERRSAAAPADASEEL